MFNNEQKASAKLSGNNLVLSLPDAMTPVVWMIDMDKSGSFFMRVDKDDNGLHILQKIEGSGADVKIEDIAYYPEKKQAIAAMTCVGKVLDKSSKSVNTAKSGGFFKSFLSFIFALLFVIILVLAALYYHGSNLKKTSIAESQTTQAVPPPQIETNPDAVGVPLSADDYLNKKGSFKLPY